MSRPIVSRRFNGEYSTIVLPGGIIETMWFGDDGKQRMVARSAPVINVAMRARQHIEDDER